MELKRLKQIGWLIVVAGVLCSLFLWGQRMQSEANYKNVQMVVNYSDIVAMANANDLTEEEFAKALQERGVSAVLYKEWSLGSLNANGQVAIEVGNNIEHASYVEKVSKEVPVSAANAYVALLDKNIAVQVKDHVLEKVPGADYYPGQVDVITIPIMVPNGDSEVVTALNKIKEIGAGFDMASIARMSALGMDTVPQLRSWDNPTDTSLRMAFDEIKAMPNLVYLLFNDKEIPGYPQKNRTVADLLKDDKGNTVVPVATIEFSDQKGLNQLGVLLNKDVIRLHTISNGEMGNLTPDSALDRWMLAARERNMRSLLVRFFDITTPGANLQGNLNYVASIQTGLIESGFTLDQPYEKPASIPASTILMAMVGTAVIAGVMLILLEMRLPKLSLLALIGGIAIWLALLLVNPTMAKKMMALLSVITFPTLSCLLIMKPEARSIGKSVVALLKLCAISYIGAVLMVGLLADILFMLKLDQFIGVKLAHVVPIVAVPFILYIWNEEKPLTFVKQLLEKALDYKWTMLGVLVAVAGVIYLSRTGNSGAELSAAESMMRTFLNDVMGVRPRSKEFLIGYPFTLLLFWLGASRKNWILTIPAIIGQVSLVNTYAHIHTALIMSMQRSFNGLVLGIAVGLLLIIGVRMLFAIYRRLEQRGL
ncbi:MAG: hypothetical protein IIV02_03295 [Peptococcaceae bacterium]|jgi:hypothetical protein|nr:hypothetical protein [Peptococcaceae bacterium]MBQ5369073.1 hypothetical protein [Peptococcaceae bacterium]MBQ5658536.1 hypothetical protein [Peptococcaceae bacterium]